MSSSVGKIFYELGLNTSNFDKGTKNVQSKLGSTGSKLVGFGAKVAKVGIIAGGVVAGLAIKGGFDRALNIENAQAKLKGLGHDAKSVEKIMGSALDSVLGTAYGLDEAATSAASAVAAGVKPGKELTRVLSITADTATITGRSFSEAGSIINKVLASNRLSMQEVNQLSDAGLPILQMLGDQYGKTSAEMRDMVSAGEVDSKAFKDALEKNIGGAALASGDTTVGAFKNMKAAFSNVGAAILTDALPKIREFFQGVTGWLKDNKDNIVKWVMTAVEYIKKYIGVLAGWYGWWWDKIKPAVKKVVDLLKEVPKAVQIVKDVFSGMDAGALMSDEDYAKWEGFINLTEKAKGIFDAVKESFFKFIGILKMVWETIQNWIMPSLSALWNTISSQLMPVIWRIVEVFKRLFDALHPALTAIIGIVLVAIFWVLINVINVVLKVFLWLVDKIALVIGWVANIINWIGNLVAIFINGFKSIYHIVMWFSDNWREIVSAILNWGLKIILWFGSLHTKIINVIGNAIIWLVQKGIDIVKGLIKGVKSMASGVWNAIKSVADQIGRFFKGAGTWLFDAGKKIIRGLVDGIKSVGHEVKEAVGDVMQKARDLLPFSPAKEGPFSGKGWTKYSGQSMMQGLAEGIQEMSALPQNAFDNALSGVNAVQNNNTSTSIYGNINIGSQSDSDHFFRRLSRNQELSAKGLSSLTGTT